MKLGQAKPNEKFKFIEISVSEAQEMRSEQTAICTQGSIINMSTEVLTSVPGNIWKVLVELEMKLGCFIYYGSNEIGSKP